MSAVPKELIALPLVIVVGIAIVAGVWLGGNGGDVSWIDDFVSTLAIPALVVGLLLAGAVAIRDAF
ncbi:hypothetical protein [Halorussus sp. AFM4]|uniref:hypothetical protein n=1 Tax=Halorussus sp. AFM4 TaxID=3421651 RepID=UPI003EBF0892